MAADIAAVQKPDDVRAAIIRWSTEFEIRGPFPGEYGRADKWYKASAKELRGYAYLKQAEIAARVNRLRPCSGR